MVLPKSDNFVGFKCPSDLRDDALALAALGSKTEAEVWKDAMEFKLGFVRMVRMGYWQLRTVPILYEVQPGLTSTVKV